MEPPTRSPSKVGEEKEEEEKEVVVTYRPIPSSRLRKPRGRSRGRLIAEE